MKRTRSLTPYVGIAVVVAALGSVALAQSDYNEAPQLAAQVEAGDLPPVAERLPSNPLVVEPVERVGDYGGTWRTALSGGGDQIWIQRTLAYENLVRLTPDLTAVVPNIAASFEADETSTEFTFTLREGMRWSDGEPFTADDIMFWYEDVLLNDELTPVKPSWLVSGDELVVVEKRDDTTLVFRFAAPNGLFIERLARSSGSGIAEFPRHYFESFHADHNENIDALVEQAGVNNWVELFQQRGGLTSGSAEYWQAGTVPSLHAWIPSNPYGVGTRLVAERNPYYWKVDAEGNQLPYLNRVTFDIVGDNEVMLLRALAGEIDMHGRHFNTLSNRAILFDNQEQGNYRFFSMAPDIMNTTILFLNLTHRNPVIREIFQNKDFRIGLSHAINRDEIIDLIYLGQGEPFQAAPRPESPFYHERLAKQYTEFDLDLANEHLDRAGYSERDAQGYRLGPDGQRITFVIEATEAIYDEIPDVLELVAQYWQEVGINAQVRIIDRSLFDTRRVANEHDVAVWAGGGGLEVILNPFWYLPISSRSDYAQAWATWYSNPEGINATTAPEEPPAATQRQMELYRELEATADPDEQARLMNEILEVAAEEFYMIGINLKQEDYGVVKNTFRNVPDLMFDAAPILSPGPTNPSQYFIEGGGQ